jgi:hypothetical protein
MTFETSEIFTKLYSVTPKDVVAYDYHSHCSEIVKFYTF